MRVSEIGRYNQIIKPVRFNEGDHVRVKSGCAHAYATGDVVRIVHTTGPADNVIVCVLLSGYTTASDFRAYELEKL